MKSFLVDLVERIKLVRLVIGVSALFLIVLQLLRLFDYDVLGKYQLVILPLIVFFTYGSTAMAQEKMTIFPWDKYQNLYEYIKSGLSSLIFLLAGIVLMVYCIITKDLLLFYMSFFLFNSGGFYLHHLAHLGDMSNDYADVQRGIEMRKDHYNDLY